MKELTNYNNYNYDFIETDKIKSEVNTTKFEKYMFGREEWIRTDRIKVDLAVQRELQETHVSRILKKFDPQSFGRLTVSLRQDGYYYCSDGQHRLECANV